jgi:hypothetical protein
VTGLLTSTIIQSLPPGWTEVPFFMPGTSKSRAFRYRDGLAVIATIEPRGGKRWAHVSCSRKDKLPSWSDLKCVKQIFLGDVMAYQVLPPEAEWLNIHEHTLHLFHCLDEDPYKGCFGKED